MADKRQLALKRHTTLLPQRASQAHGRQDHRHTVTPTLRPLTLSHTSQAAQAAPVLQTALTIGAANDPYEHEAQRTADTVMSMPDKPVRGITVGGIAASLMRLVRRSPGKDQSSGRKDEDDKHGLVQKASADGLREAGAVPSGVETSIRQMSMGGEALSPALRGYFEPRFGHDFGAVRVHTGGEANAASAALDARAFTVGEHVFFGAGQYQPASASGRHLIAHELTHTIQQGGGSGVASRVQREGGLFSFDPKALALGKLRDWADKLPPYEALTVLVGRDPITEQSVDPSPRNIVHATLKMVPDGMAIFDDMEKNQTIDKTVREIQPEVARLNLSWTGIKALFQQAIEAVGGALAILNPLDAWDKIKAVFAPTLERVRTFALAVGTRIAGWVKKAMLDKLGAWAKEQKGYPLLTAALGRDLVTGEAVPRTARGLVKAVLELVPGGDKIFENLEKTKAIERTMQWLQGAIARLDLSWEKIKALFRTAWDSFSLRDLLLPLTTLLGRIADIFLEPALRVARFALEAGKKVLEFVFEGAMMIAGPIGLQIIGIVRKAGDAFNKIVEDPIGFIHNLVSAVKLGFQQFGKNIWEHLKNGIIGWLVGALEGAGLKLPKVWDLRGVLDLVVQVLGVTYAKMRVKIVKVIGEEKVAKLERVFDFIRLVVTEGPAAAWQKIVETIGSLWDMVIGGIKSWAVTNIVTAAVTKLATMLNPAGAIIQAIIAIYNTVAFFVERIQQIVALVGAIVDSIANIAAGKLTQAANYVEQVMARTVPVLLGFLSRLIGLGDISGAIKNVVTAIQQKVDKAIDAVIAWVVEKAKALFGKKDKPHDEKWAAGVAGVKAEVEKLEKADDSYKKIEAAIPKWKEDYGFSVLKLEQDDDGWDIDGAMSPGQKFIKRHYPGSLDNPFELVWQKPAYTNREHYPPIYLGGRTTKKYSQSWFKANEGVIVGGKNVQKYTPDTQRNLPEGVDIGGINDTRTSGQTYKGKVMGPLRTEGTPGGGLLRDNLAKYGFDGSEYQADHIVEYQFGGDNTRRNLWPLTASVNSTAGPAMAGGSVRDPVTKKDYKVSNLKEKLKAGKKRKYFFKVTDFKW